MAKELFDFESTNFRDLCDEPDLSLRFLRAISLILGLD